MFLWTVLLRQLIRVNNALCIRGYWNTPEDVSRVAMIELFKSQIQQSGLLDLKDALYFPKFTGKWIFFEVSVSRKGQYDVEGVLTSHRI